MQTTRRKLLAGAALSVLFPTAISVRAQASQHTDFAAGDDWESYLGPGASHFSALADINTSNVAHLQQAWVYDSGDASGQGASATDMECNPLIISGRLYFVSPAGRAICIDAATGAELWVFNPAGGANGQGRQRLRGVSYWRGEDERIFFTYAHALYALDAHTGQPIASFGAQGHIDLSEGITRDPASISVSNVTPGAIYKDVIIMGSTGNTPGDIRAFDVRTGAVRWVFHTIPHPGEFGYETWPREAWRTAMGANCWAGITVDPTRGVVYIPLASPGMGDKDFYGGDRPGDNLFGNCLLALNADTGERVWHYQTVRHDIWDRDLPAPPTLCTILRGAAVIDAVAQITKSGFVFVFNRDTGEPLFPIEERPAFPSTVRGEHIASTQRLPSAPAPFARQHVTEDLLTTRTPQAAAAVRQQFAHVSSRGPWDPPSEDGTILFSGMDGGGEWGGAAFDPETHNLYVNANEMAWIMRLVPQRVAQGVSGAAIYANNCAACHGENRQGSPPEFPSLVGVRDRLTRQQMITTVTGGRGRMPGFEHLGAPNIRAVVEYLRNGGHAPAAATAAQSGAPHYNWGGYNRFLDPDGYPAIKPPWGTLNAINLDSGDYGWKIPFGEYPELVAAGLRDTGSENYGGPIVTAGGLLFIAATSFDRKFRAFDKRTGALLWETLLPASGNSTPATYRAGGRQFVVIPAGGGKDPKTPPTGKLIAFALPA
ncbi:MAG: PQQ-binding-like beta-propeller repeat protein [Pseudomonadota bacterium]